MSQMSVQTKDGIANKRVLCDVAAIHAAYAYIYNEHGYVDIVLTTEGERVALYFRANRKQEVPT